MIELRDAAGHPQRLKAGSKYWGGVKEGMNFEDKRNHRKALIFDIGGVLLDWNPRHLYRKFFNGDEEGMEQFLAEIGFNEWNLHQDAGRPFVEAVNELKSRHPTRAELIEAYHTRWEESINGTIEPTIDILVELREKGYPLYGLSNFSTEKFPLVQQRYGFFDWFDDILLSAEVNLVKPDPRIYHVLLKRIEREPEECIMIDDSAQNVDSARQVGIDGIHFRSPDQLKVELTKRGIL
jgi:2-haloacid dehalogenase